MSNPKLPNALNLQLTKEQTLCLMAAIIFSSESVREADQAIYFAHDIYVGIHDEDQLIDLLAEQEKKERQ